MKKLLITIALSISMNANASGWPVYDAVDDANGKIEIMKLVAQLQQLKQMYDMATRTFNAVASATKGGGYTTSQVMQLKQYLPPEYQQLLNTAQYGNSLQYLREYQTADLAKTTLPENSQQAEQFLTMADLRSKSRAEFEEAFETANTTFPQISSLIDQLQSARTMKESQDVTAKATLMAATLQNEANRISSLVALNAAETELQKQKANSNIINVGVGGIPSAWGSAGTGGYNRTASYTSDGMLIE